jgi:glycosyltransferase involved in cell wall biosynthesis
MYDTLREVITNSTLRDDLRRRGSERIKDFSLQKMVQQTCDVYRKVL